MDILWYVIYFVTTKPFLVMVTALFILPVAVSLSGWKGHLAKYYSLFGVLAFLNLFFGTAVGVRTVHAFGEQGTATITGSYGTSTQYNNHNVVGYHVLLKAVDGKVVETSFEDDDFNIYPPKNAVTYPGVGDHFTVYYLRWFPHDFIIVDNDDSPWASALRCARLRDSVQEANAKYEFDRGNAAYRDGYIAEIKKVLADKCVTDKGEREEFRRDIRNVEAGQP
jgi:hypothetical protein